MIRLTILNSMAGGDFAEALDRHVEWGLRVLDLKDGVFGKSILDLTDEEAHRADEMIRGRGLSVHCLSTALFHLEIERGEEEFRGHLDQIGRTIELARILRPQLIRLLAARTTNRQTMADSIPYIEADCPWLVPMYGEAIDRLYDAGFASAIENEVDDCIFSNPDEITAFFERLGRREKVCFTWDVQNLWQTGVLPSMEVYTKLKGLIGYYHLKGGRSDEGSSQLRWRSSLEDASWPVVEITRRVAADAVSPVICLNPSHGRPIEGYDYTDVTKRDIDFVRRVVPGVE